MRPPFGDPRRLLQQAKTEGRTLEGQLRSWHRTHTPGPQRPFDEQPIAVTLLDFYRHLVRRRNELAASDHLEAHERFELRDIEEALTRKEDPRTLLDQLSGDDKRGLTGDAVTDDLIDRLDRGEVPPEFWGPDGPPDSVPSLDVKQFAVDDGEAADWWRDEEP
jgi:hypothetical protein